MSIVFLYQSVFFMCQYNNNLLTIIVFCIVRFVEIILLKKEFVSQFLYIMLYFTIIKTYTFNFPDLRYYD